jgi:hypothetical protein
MNGPPKRATVTFEELAFSNMLQVQAVSCWRRRACLPNNMRSWSGSSDSRRRRRGGADRISASQVHPWPCRVGHRTRR